MITKFFIRLHFNSIHIIKKNTTIDRKVRLEISDVLIIANCVNLIKTATTILLYCSDD